MKRVLCWIGGIVLVLAAVLAIVISQLDTEFISGQISAAVEKATAFSFLAESGRRTFS